MILEKEREEYFYSEFYFFEYCFALFRLCL